jgi:GT2 family glycosyltransferase
VRWIRSKKARCLARRINKGDVRILMIAGSVEELDPLVSVIVPHHNRPEVLANCLESLDETAYPRFEVIVVDDCSTDNSAEFISSHFPKVTLVLLRKNVGYGGACNAGAAIARGSFFAFLNNDTRVDSMWLRNLVDFCAKTGASVVTPKILFLNDPTIINAAGGSYSFLGIAWNRGNGETDHGQYSSAKPVFYGSACIFVRRRVWELVGGFDEDFFMYFEDVDWCWRALTAGHRTMYLPESVVYHAWDRAQRDPAFVIRYYERNALTTVLKNYQSPTVPIALTLFLAVRLVAVIYFARRFPEVSRLIVEGVGTNIRSLPQTLRKRIPIERIRVNSDSEALRGMSSAKLSLLMIAGRASHPLIASISAEDRP